MTVFVDGVGLFAPGLPGWDKSTQAVLKGKTCYQGGELPPFAALPLPRNEARRAGFNVRLALQAAMQAAGRNEALGNGENLATVFACSGGDTEALHGILSALSEAARPVSPNQFNNSVHNAPAGYWSIATGSMAASSSLSAYDASFAAGLLDAYSSVTVLKQPVLLVAYDMPPPGPMLAYRKVPVAFAAALLLNSEMSGAGRYRLQVALAGPGEEDSLDDPALERLRLANPAARALPLLRRLALNAAGAVRLPYLSGGLVGVDCQPC